MSGTGYVIAPQIPQGLDVLVEGLAREILRRQPSDVYNFAAHHFEKLIKLREQGSNVEVVPQVPDVIEETAAAMRTLTTSVVMKKLAKKYREDTNSCGWSINPTAKVLKKYERKRDVKSKEVEKKWSKETIRHGEIHRSSSVGDLLGANVKREFGSGVGNFCDSIILNRHARSAEQAYERCLKRQKTPDYQFTSEQRCIVDRRRSASIANVKSWWKDSIVEQRTTLDSEESTIDRCENQRERKLSIDHRRDRKRLEETLRGKGDASIKRSKLRSEKDESETKSSERDVEIFDAESCYDLSRINGFDAASRQRNEHIAAALSTGQEIREESLMVFPSVVTRQSSGRCSTNGKHEADEGVRNNLILPPISNDSSKLVKRESSLTLPHLPNERTTNTSGGDDPEGPDDRNEEKIRITDVEATKSSDYDSSNVIQSELISSTSGKEKIVCRNNSYLDHERDESQIKIEEDINKVEGEIAFLPETIARNTDDTALPSEHIEDAGFSHCLDTNMEEVFKDSLNVTPDSIECSQRSDSLEHLQKENALKLVDDDEQSDKENSKEQQVDPSNELKQKLMEIETVERSIESALISSGKEAVVPIYQSNEAFPIEHSIDTNIETDKGMLENANVSTSDNGQNRDGSGDGNDSFKNGRDEAEIETAIDSNGSSKISLLKSMDNTDTDRSDASNPMTRRSSANIDPCCYVLTEGSPCEIPESVTTVIIPDKSFRTDEDTMDQDGSCSSKTVSPGKEEAAGEYQHDEHPFGDLMRSGTDDSSGVDFDFLREIRDAVDRVTAAGQDLQHIEEEEEGERVKDDPPCSEQLSSEVTNSRSDESRERLETLENECCIETSENSSERSAKQEKIEEAEEEGTFNRRSLDDTTPYVPELNLDSLRDVTMSSFDVSDTEDADDRCRRAKSNEEETIDVVPSREEEDAMDALVSSPLEESVLSSILTSKPSSVELEDERPRISEQTEDRSIESPDDNRTDMSVHGTNGDRSFDTEEEIARELISNLILETSRDVDSIRMNPEETKGDNGPATRENGEDQVIVAAVNMTGMEERKDEEERDEEERLKNEDINDIVEDRSTMINLGKGDHENDSSSSSSAVYLGTNDRPAVDLENVSEQEKGIVANDTFASDKSFETAARTIQSWVRMFLLRHGQLLEAGAHQGQEDSLRPTVTVNLDSSLTSEHVQETTEVGSALPNEVHADGSNDVQELKETRRLVNVNEAKDSDWSTDESEDATSFRHTSEFHDSLVLPILLEDTKVVSEKDACTPKATTTDIAADSKCIECKESVDEPATEIGLGPKPPPSLATVVYAIDLSRDLRGLQSVLPWHNASLNFPLCSDQVEPVINDKSQASVDRSTGNASSLDTDDILEPLALDNEKPRPSIVIEEISNDDEVEKEIEEEEEEMKKE